MPEFRDEPWVEGPPLAKRRVAIVSSAVLVVRGEKPFRGRDPDYRVIPSDTRADQLMFSHISINLDRSGLQEDRNVVFLLDRLQELAGERLSCARGNPTADRCRYEASRIISARDCFTARPARARSATLRPRRRHAGLSNFRGLADASG
jgi:hypothetical protein